MTSARMLLSSSTRDGDSSTRSEPVTRELRSIHRSAAKGQVRNAKRGHERLSQRKAQHRRDDVGPREQRVNDEPRAELVRRNHVLGAARQANRQAWQLVGNE